MKHTLIYCVIALSLLVSCNSSTQSKNQESIVGMELPKLTSQTSEQIIQHTAMTISYNLKWNLPNWVAYTLTSAETTGEYGRKNTFYPDPNIKHNPVVTQDYSHSGYDRGHMAPAADMKWSGEVMDECFYLSNICPQDHKLNTGVWKSLEEKCREYARYFGNIYIVCGPVVKNNQYGTIGDNGVMVPDGFFKVLLAPYYGKYSAIGFLFDERETKGGLTGMMGHGIGNKTHVQFRSDLFHNGGFTDSGRAHHKNWTLALYRNNVSSEFVFSEICFYGILNLFFSFFDVHFLSFPVFSSIQA